MDLQCPRCAAPLKPVAYEDVPLQRCSGCSGEWLQGDQLRMIIDARNARFTADERAELEARQRTFVPESIKKDLPVDCPQGHGRMLKYRYAGDSPIVLDRCELCDGLWLDHGELEHVQMLAETWEKDLARDLSEQGPLLAKLQQQKKASIEGTLARSPLVRALMDGILGWRV
ncbi:MAG: zf-TFIIB domain-containing protein [Candidatus Riflebacteria bacterium]|nr:zf-TFIIB domain-containing protein [Candidatus Riflebacteria bacterium]